MLTNVPEAVNRLARNVVMNHPNTYNCQVFRRVAHTPPDLGGVGMLDEEDEEALEYEWIGNGYALQAEPFQPALMMDRRDAQNGTGTEFRFLIEPEQPTGAEGNFLPRNRDILYLLLGTGDAPAKLAFEIVGTEAVVNVPPYSSRYIANRRDDLHLPAGPFDPEPDPDPAPDPAPTP